MWVVEAQPLASRAEGLAREAEDVEVDPRNGGQIPFAAVFVDAHILAMHRVNEVADVGILFGNEEVHVGHTQHLQR